MLKENWVKVDISQASNLALVLDVSETAQPHWPTILRLALELLGRVPDLCRCSVYFLGDAKVYAPDDLRQESARLFREHCGRASLLSPVLEVLAKQQDTVCVVLRAGRIYDLEDWSGTPIAERLVFASFDESPIVDDGFFECTPSVDEILESWPLRARLGPPIRVEISGTEVMPFYWDNPAYEFVERKLVAEGTKEWIVHFGVLCLSENDIRATAIVAGNRTRGVEFKFCSYEPGVIWQSLTPSEAAMFRQVVQAGRFNCAICGQQHSGQYLRCPNDDKRLLGSYVYSSIRHRSGPGFVLLRGSGEDVEFSYHDCQALRIGEESVAVRSEGRTSIYEFDRGSHAWRIRRQPFKQYQLVRDQTYAVVF